MAKTTDVYKSGMRGDEKSKRGALRSVRIEVADGGFTVECDYEPARNGKSQGFEIYRAPKPKVFEKLDDVLSWVRETLNGKGEEKEKK